MFTSEWPGHPVILSKYTAEPFMMVLKSYQFSLHPTLQSSCMLELGRQLQLAEACGHLSCASSL